MSGDTEYETKVRKATLMLLLEGRGPERETELRSEVLLERAGFGPTEIAELLGKQAGAVRTTLSRARKGEKGG
jgi:DNA-directed RNA polymerase specialized sigma24 family protein